MGSYLRLVITLTAIAAAASFGLSAVYNSTHEITEELKRQEQASARVEALGCTVDAVFEETVTDSVIGGRPFSYYTAYADESKTDVLGYAFSAYGKGYSSTIETIVGVQDDGSICGVKIVDQKETPGLGAKVQEVASQNTLWAVLSGHAVDESGKRPWFQVQYEGLKAADLRVVKSPSEEGILAITGATISSEAVTSSVRHGLRALMEIVEESGTGTSTADSLGVASEAGIEHGVEGVADEGASGGTGPGGLPQEGGGGGR